MITCTVTKIEVFSTGRNAQVRFHLSNQKEFDVLDREWKAENVYKYADLSGYARERTNQQSDSRQVELPIKSLLAPRSHHYDNEDLTLAIKLASSRTSQQIKDMGLQVKVHKTMQPRIQYVNFDRPSFASSSRKTLRKMFPNIG